MNLLDIRLVRAGLLVIVSAFVNMFHHLPGIPQVPDIPTGTSTFPGSVVLTLHTPASGRMPSQMFLFLVNFTQTSNGIQGSRTINASDYVDGEDRQFTIDGLIKREYYVFSAQARNQFGSSDFSENSDFINSTAEATETRQPSESINSNICNILLSRMGVETQPKHCLSKFSRRESFY